MNSVGSYKFKNVNLLERALTHSSYSKDNYERLEFLGDSLLDFIVGKYFFLKSNEDEGKLTKKRAYFVSEKHLSKVFDKLIGIKNIKVGKSCIKISNSIKCDIVESVIGAMLLDSDIYVCEKFIIKNFMLDEKIDSFIDFKSKLQEYSQKYRLNLSYNLIKIDGEAHNPTFIFECVCGKYKTKQSGKSKHIAQQNCAKKILDMITKEQKGEF